MILTHLVGKGSQKIPGWLPTRRANQTNPTNVNNIATWAGHVSRGTEGWREEGGKEGRAFQIETKARKNSLVLLE